jgi:hypothetical protein
MREILSECCGDSMYVASVFKVKNATYTLNDQIFLFLFDQKTPGGLQWECAR